MDAIEYLSVLNKEQREAVVHTGSPLLILAGAGSGKTRVITTKIAYMISELGYNPYSILAVTFTKKAAAEMLERAIFLEEKAEKCQIRTFHSFGSWFLRRYYEEAGLDKNFTVYDDDDMVSLLTKAVPELNTKSASSFAHSISRAKDYCLLPENSDEFGKYDIPTSQEFIKIYEIYQERLKKTGNVDFGDLIMLPTLLLRSDKKIQADIHARFKVVMVDEYQDSNVAQFALLQQLVGQGTYVCVVGDDDQSIYKFRGAEVQNILSFSDHFAGTQVIKLETNYRSIPPVLSAANDVIQNNENRLGKTLKAFRTGTKKPVLAFLNNQDDEAAYIADMIQQSHARGVPYADWAILYRTNAQSLGFETEFLQRKIPYSVVGSLKFYQREEIKDALSFLAFLANQRDEIAFTRIVNKPTRGIGKSSQQKITECFYAHKTDDNDYSLLNACEDCLEGFSAKAKSGLKDFLALVASLRSLFVKLDTTTEQISLEEKRIAQLALFSLENKEVDSSSEQKDGNFLLENEKLSFLIDTMIQKSGLFEYYESQDEIAHTQKVNNLQELINSATLYSLSEEGLTQFLDQIELDRSLELAEQQDDNPDKVTLITLHNTKGLEFPRVVITGMELGVFPRSEENDIEEERRLFYVGITRAKDELYFTSCAYRRMYGKTQLSLPSPFLKELNLNSLQTIGKIPFVFEQDEENSSVSDTSLEGRWAKGKKVFHDDYGYGYILSGSFSEDEYVIAVQFEIGVIKRFMPKYQANKLMLCNDSF
ncbi:MAG: ATP-dependent helicase [Spirochaetaceae bacterium]|nr:ATP-dependent helicase [Spirochaetaceae bacterium]